MIINSIFLISSERSAIHIFHCICKKVTLILISNVNKNSVENMIPIINDNPELLKKWRDDTPGCRYRNHLNNAGAALMPRPVIQAIKKHLDLETEIGGYEAADVAAKDISFVYTSVADLLGTEAKNIAAVENATVATSQALSAFDYKKGDKIITTSVDYASNQIMLLSLAERFGIEIIRANDLQEGGVDPESVQKLIHKHNPKLVLMSWIPTNSGLIQDANTIGEICRNEEVPFILDACQAVGQIPVNVDELHCDFLAATARKFLRGPRGIGFLYVSDRMLQQNRRPLFPDTHGAAWTAPDTYQLEPDAKRFENWEFSYALLLGMGAAADYSNNLDLNKAGNRAFYLAEHVRNQFSTMPGVRLLDHGENLCAIVSVEIEEKNPADIVKQLRKVNINTSAASRTAGVIDMASKNADSILRISPHYYNTENEIEELFEALKELIS